MGRVASEANEEQVAAWRAERWLEMAGSWCRPDGWWLGRGAFGFRGACRESAALV